MPSRFVTANGCRLHVVDHGGSGPSLLLSHGTGLCAGVWEPVVPHLTPHFRVWALDRRGHGDSDKPPDGQGLADVAGDYAPVVAGLGLDGALALGHSAGGTTLGIAAARHPGLFARLALVDPIIFAAGPGPGGVRATAALVAQRTARRRAEWPSAQAMHDGLAARAPYDTWTADALWAYVRHGATVCADGSVALKCPPALEATMYGHPGALDLFAELAPIRVPVLVLRGARTDRFPRASAERAVAEMADARLVELPGLTHFAPMEDPALVARYVVPFLLGRVKPSA